MLTALLVLVAIVAAIGVWLAAIYNRLVELRNRFRNTFAQIDVQLKRRHDLVPNLVETTRGYLKHERETLEAVIAARNQAAAAERRAAERPGDPQAMHELSGAETGLLGALGRLLAVAEAYPDLKANQTMAQLMEELASTENRVAFSRQAYNDAVMTYNTNRESFPTMLLAPSFGFGPAVSFELGDEAQREVPRVSFS